jgi:hypothetical protein
MLITMLANRGDPGFLLCHGPGANVRPGIAAGLEPGATELIIPQCRGLASGGSGRAERWFVADRMYPLASRFCNNPL